MKKSLLAILLCLMFCSTAAIAEETETNTPPIEVTVTEQYDFSYQLVEKIKKERNTIYNALNLTPAQIKCKNEIEKKRYIELEPALQKFCLESKKLKDLKAANADKSAICRQEKALNNVRHEIQKISSKYDNYFAEILTYQQHTKYDMIRKLRKDDLKKMQKIQEHGRKESDVKPFGKPISQAEYTQQQHDQNCILHKMIKKCKKKK